jgi:hypothetical protein
MVTPPASPRPLVSCPACRGPLRPVGRVPLRRDAQAAGYLIPLQPGEVTPAISLDAYRCQDCGRIDFYDHDFLLAAV